MAYAVAARLWSVLAGPVSILLIARHLTLEEQGYYYTFGSLLAVQMFFELGLTGLLVTFAAHEAAHLRWNRAGLLTGQPRAFQRLRSLLRAATRWYLVAAVGFTLVAWPLGFSLMQRQANGLPASAWVLAWTEMVLTTALQLAVVPGVAILEGCGRIRQISYVRWIQALVGNTVFWVGLAAGARLNAAAASVFCGWLALAVWLWRAPQRRPLGQLLRVRRTVGAGEIHWGKEIWPLQWKMALTWISGYLAFQLFVPVLFLFHGPQAAARMGMSLNLTGRISDLALTWVSTKQPGFAALVARRNYPELDVSWRRATLASLGVATLLGACLWALVMGLDYFHHPYAARVLPPGPLALLLVTTGLHQIIFCQATYLRAHKEEPLLPLSMVSAATVAGLTYLFGRFYGAPGMTLAYFLYTLLVWLGVATLIFNRCRRRWRTAAALAA